MLAKIRNNLFRRKNLAPVFWHYVRSSINPADIASRGISAKKLISSDQWWKGPNPRELNLIEYETDKATQSDISHDLKISVKPTLLTVDVLPDICNISRFSNINRALRTMVYVFRLFHKRWKSEYLLNIVSCLTKKKYSVLNIWDVVLLNEGEKRDYWPLARVFEIHPCRDGLIGSVKSRLYCNLARGMLRI